jgi:hypothetical protein
VTDLLTPAQSSRYPHLPGSFASFLGAFGKCHNAREDSWFLGPNEYRSKDPTGFRWNECELMSLKTIEDDEAAGAIRRYWDKHIPFMVAVHSEYDYLALQTCDDPAFCAVVHGSAPEFETSSVVAPSFEAFLVAFQEAAESTDPSYPLALFR